MQLQYGNPDIRFKYRTLTGVRGVSNEPDYLILDGQQRLTSIFQATFSKEAVNTVVVAIKMIVEKVKTAFVSNIFVCFRWWWNFVKYSGNFFCPFYTFTSVVEYSLMYVVCISLGVHETNGIRAFKDLHCLFQYVLHKFTQMNHYNTTLHLAFICLIYILLIHCLILPFMIVLEHVVNLNCTIVLYVSVLKNN